MEIQAYQPRQRNTMMIKNLCPGLVELGKIKIGNKGVLRKSQSGTDWQAPQKLDHFLITTNERGADNNFILDNFLHGILGDSPKIIPVRLIYDDISLNFATRYICYYGKTVFCSGDGEEAQRLQKDGTHKTIVCPCERQDPKFTGDDGKGKGKCKINGILSVIIDGAQAVGGVWKFRTTSYNSVVGILSSLALIQRIAGGRLAGIPLNMTVSPKTVANPVDGKQQTIYVVGLQYTGTIDTLRDTGYQIAITEAKHGISMSRIEEDARLMLTHKPIGGAGLGDDNDQDVIEEFYPEEAVSGTPALVAPPALVVPDPPPALVAPQTEIIDAETGEITETPVETQEQKQKRTRRTKAEIEAEKAATVQTPPADPNPVDGGAFPATDEEGWPDPPEPVPETTAPAQTAPAQTAPAAEIDEEMGDLF